MRLLAVFALESLGPMLRDDGGCCHHVDLLNHSGRLIGGRYVVTAIRTSIERVVPEVVNLVFLKESPLMPRVARLDSTFSLLLGFLLWTARFYDVAGPRLGGV